MVNSMLLTIFFVGVVTAICPHEESGLLGWSTPAAWNNGEVCCYLINLFDSIANLCRLLTYKGRRGRDRMDLQLLCNQCLYHH